MKISMPLIETAVSWQGEGQFQGELCVFMRFKKCNRFCEFCDTRDRMDTVIEKSIKFEKLFELGKMCRHSYVFTGGEPTLYIPYIVDFIQFLETKFVEDSWEHLPKISFETNGCNLVKMSEKIAEIVKNTFLLSNIYYDFSPKDFHKEYDFQESLDIIDSMAQLRDNFIVKVVAYDHEQNYGFTDLFLAKVREKYPNLIMYVMPEGRTGMEVMLNTPKILSIVNKHQCNFSSRLHLIHNFY